MTARNIPEASSQIDRHQSDRSTLAYDGKAIFPSSGSAPKSDEQARLDRLHTEATGKALSPVESPVKPQGTASNDVAQSILDRSRLVIDDSRLLAQAGSPGEQAKPGVLRSAVDAAKEIEALKAFDSNFSNARRDPPSPNMTASPVDSRTFIPQVPVYSRPNIPVLPVDNRVPTVDTSKQPEKPVVSGEKIKAAREALHNRYTANTAEEALAIKQKAKDLGLPLVVYFGVDQGCGPCLQAKALLAELEGGKFKGKTLKGEKHGEAVFLHIKSGKDLGDSEAFENARTIAESLGGHLGRGVPYVAAYDPYGKKIPLKGGWPDLKESIPAPLPPETSGLKG